MNDRNVWIRIWTSVSIAATLALGLLFDISVPMVHAATSTVIDDFETGDYTGGTGWTGNWVEVNDSGVGQSPTSGDIRIVSDGGSQRLRVKDDNRGAYRLADLSSASAAFLTFEYRRGNLNSTSDYVLVQLSSNGASGPWTEVGRIEGGGSDASYIRISFDITSHISAQTAVRFFSSPSLSNGEPIYFDNVEIIHSDTLGDFCYLVADGGGGNGGDDWMTFIVKSSGAQRPIGTGTGTNTIEAVAYWSGTSVLYAAAADELGSLDPVTGEYTTIGGFGSGDGALGTLAFSDVDSLAFDPFSGVLYGVHRRAGASEEDVLIQIDTGTGQHIPDAFGPGVDYVVVSSGAVTGYYDVDDIAISSADGTMHAIANNGGSGDRLVVVDRTNGNVTDVGALGVNDMEGLSYDILGNLFGSSGFGDSGGEGLYDINIGTGAASNRRALDVGNDYEAAACLLASGVNTISGSVFQDEDGDGNHDPEDTGTSGVTVRLYRDTNGDGIVDGGDVLLVTQDTDGAGYYSFSVVADGDFVLEIDASGLPAGHTFTTDNVEDAGFVSFGNLDGSNDFGHQPPTAVTLASFTANWEEDAVLIVWETTLEVDTVGFNLWRSTTPDGEYEQINDALIPAASPGGVEGGFYAYADVGVALGTTYYYKLEEWEVGGTGNWYGPISTTGDDPTAVTFLVTEAVTWDSSIIVLGIVAVAVGAGLVVLRPWRRRH